MSTRRGRFDATRPFRRSEALAAGVTLRELLGPRYQRVFHGVYVRAGLRLTPLERGRAALHISAAATFVSHHTAALIWGGVPPEDRRTHVSVPGDNLRSVRRGIAAHRAGARRDLRTLRGVPVSSPAQCFCEIATDGAGVVELVVLGDSLVRANAVTAEELIDAADHWPGRRCATASKAARLVRDGVDSPMESRLRMLIVLAGLPEPVVNFVIRQENGDWEARFDLCYPELKLLIEFDGDHHLDAAQQARDLERRELIEGWGWRIIVIQKNHFYREPDHVLQRVRRARLDRGARSSSCIIRSTWINDFAA